MKNKVVERRNGRYQINEGIFGIIKASLVGKTSDIRKLDDKKLSAAGLEMKKNVMNMEKIIDKMAAVEGKSKEEYTQNIAKELGIKL